MRTFESYAKTCRIYTFMSMFFKFTIHNKDLIKEGCLNMETYLFHNPVKKVEGSLCFRLTE